MNPGPKILPLCLYMLSSGVGSRVRLSPGTGILERQPEEISLSAPQACTNNQPVESTPRIRSYRRRPVERHSSLRCQCVVIIVCDYI